MAQNSLPGSLAMEKESSDVEEMVLLLLSLSRLYQSSSLVAKFVIRLLYTKCMKCLQAYVGTTTLIGPTTTTKSSQGCSYIFGYPRVNHWIHHYGSFNLLGH